MNNKTYEIIEDGTGLFCLLCGMVTHNKENTRRKYCLYCNTFHQDVELPESETIEKKAKKGKEKKDKERVLMVAISTKPRRSVGLRSFRKR